MHISKATILDYGNVAYTCDGCGAKKIITRKAFLPKRALKCGSCANARQGGAPKKQVVIDDGWALNPDGSLSDFVLNRGLLSDRTRHSVFQSSEIF